MQKNLQEWKVHDHWGAREFILLLLLEFAVIIGGIKFIVKPLYSKVLENELYAGTLMGLTIAIMLLLGVYFIALRPKQLSWQEVGIRIFPMKDWGLIIAYSIFVLIGAVFYVLLIDFLGFSWENSKTESLQQNITVFSVLIAFISAAIISPIYEEIFYRGFLYRWLRTRIGLTGGLLLSSLIFSVAHIPTYNVMPVNFLSGMIFAYAYERTNSILPSILIHGITNGLMVLLTSFG